MSQTCKHCGRIFEPLPDHKGKINECLNCVGQDVELLMAEVSWEGKQTPIIKVTTASKAIAFNKALRRNNAGPLASIIAPKETKTGVESSKRGTGAGASDLYYSKLGEKRTVVPMKRKRK